MEPFSAPAEPGSDRQAVMPDDLLHYHKLWDAQLYSAFARFNLVPQPLSELIDENFTEKIRLIAAGIEDMDSILNCYYDPEKRMAA